MRKRSSDHRFRAVRLCRAIVLSGGLLGTAMPAMAEEIQLQRPAAGLPGRIQVVPGVGGLHGAGASADATAEGPAGRLPGAFTFTVPVQVTDLVANHASVSCSVASSSGAPAILYGHAPIPLHNGSHTGTITVEVHNNRGYDPATLALLDRWACSLVVPGSHEGEYQCTMGWCGLYEDQSAPIDLRVRPGAVTSVSGGFPAIHP